MKKFVGSSIYYNDSMNMSSWDEDDFEKFLAFIKDICGGGLMASAMAAKWLDHVMEGRWDAVAAVLLSLLPNLEEIDMVAFHGVDSPYMDKVLNLATRRQSNGSAEGFLQKVSR